MFKKYFFIIFMFYMKREQTKKSIKIWTFYYNNAEISKKKIDNTIDYKKFNPIIITIKL